MIMTNLPIFSNHCPSKSERQSAGFSRNSWRPRERPRCS